MPPFKLLIFIGLITITLRETLSEPDSSPHFELKRNTTPDEESTVSHGQVGSGRIKFTDLDSQNFFDQHYPEPTNTRQEATNFFGEDQEVPLFGENTKPTKVVFGDNVEGASSVVFETKFNDERPQNDEDIASNENSLAPDSFDNSNSANGVIAFQDDNNIGIGSHNQVPQKKRKRRRRRKPKNNRLPYAPEPQSGVRPGYPPGYPVYPQNGGQYPGIGRPQFRPPVRPSLASEALTSVTNALSSVAVYDDYRCVPRLLCEAAGGSLGASGIAQTAGGLQPLVTLLSAYSGMTTSPLFLFGQAALLGMTSKGNPSPCRYAYPLCPTDPEELVNYLNNHNGGFFRFFNGNPQNVQQFYHSLAGQDPAQQNLNIPQQNFDSYQHHLNQFQQHLNPSQQSYGFHHQNNQIYNQGNYQTPVNGQILDNNSPYQQNFGLFQQSNGQNNGNKYGYHNPNRNNNGYNNNAGVYGKDYNYNKYLINGNNKIQKRIQNNPTKPESYGLLDNVQTHNNFDFPDNINENFNNNDNKNFGSKLRFPKNGYKQPNINYNTNRYPKRQAYVNNQNDNTFDNRAALLLLFDRLKNEFQHIANNQNNQNNQQGYYSNSNSNYNNYGSNNANDNNAFNNNNAYNNKQTATDTLYIVRGNGDPNNPEIVKLRPGETLQNY